MAAAVVLSGGRSSRMGAAKAGLEWHGSTLLRRVVGLVARGVDGPVLVVRSPGQALPALPAGVEVLDDPFEGRGPLQGIAVGLAALQGRTDGAFVCSTDLPFLHPAFVRRVLGALTGDTDVVLPHVHGFRQPLAAAYATSLAALAASLVADGVPAPKPLLDAARTVVLDDAALLEDAVLRAADPGLRSVENVNDRAAYDAVRAEPAPEVVVERYGVLASGGRSGAQAVRAATVGHAAAQVGVALDRHVLAAVNGDQTSRDPGTPLVAGDVVALLSADAGG
jgi:molybdopterin-guanine dinucleotide biosynthesis protein A